MIDKREITPELLARITVVLFKNISVKDVLERKLRFDRLSAADIRRIMLKDDEFIRTRSDESCESLARSVIDYVNRKRAWQGNGASRDLKFLNIFDRFAVLFGVAIVLIYAHLLTVGGAYNGKELFFGLQKCILW